MNATPDPNDGLDPALQAEIDAALGGASFEDLVTDEASDQPTQERGGKRPRREGTVVSIRDREVLIEFGPKLQGVCPLNQFDESPAIGARETFTIDRTDQGLALLRLDQNGFRP